MSRGNATSIVRFAQLRSSSKPQSSFVLSLSSVGNMFKSARIALSLGGSICAVVAAFGAALAEDASPPASPGATSSQQARSEPPPAAVSPGATLLPEIHVTAPKQTAARPGQNLPMRANAPAIAATTAAPAVQPSPNLGVGLTAATTVPPLQQTLSLGKTGTKLEDLPISVQIINRDVINQQGAVSVLDALPNASGIVAGGQDGHYLDLFLIRGLSAQFYNDGFRDGDQLGGFSHMLNGVKQVEILEGPGSALFGSGPPGGTINIVHYTPSSDFHYGASAQTGSFGTINSTGYVTGPTSIPGLNYRIDGTASYTDGFRGLKASDYEIRPDVVWNVDNHKLEFSLDARQLNQTPDSYGIIYYNGSPLKSVPIDAKYSWPGSYANQNYIRPTVTDQWFISDMLTVNNRLSYLYRDVDLLRTGDSLSTKIDTTQGSPTYGQVVNLQLRNQHDVDNSFDYQFEPVWKFATGGMGHTLLTGFEYVHQIIDTQRTTAPLANIQNAFAPVPPELLASTPFLCGKPVVSSKPGPQQIVYVPGQTALAPGQTVGESFSCDSNHLAADYYSLYATDQVDVTDRLKVRAGVRQDWWNTALTPLINVPGGTFNNEGVPLTAGVMQSRYDAPVSWNAGALYKLFPGVSPFVGVSKSYLSNFNSENAQTGIGSPESALQYEAGLRFSLLNDRITLNTAVFDVTRDNVAAPVTINGFETVVFDSQRTRGYEASLDAAMTDQWRVLANFTAQNAVITDNPQGLNIVGNRPQSAPAYMANLWTTYKFSIGGVPGFIAGLGVNYQDKSYSDPSNVNWIPAFVIGNALLGYDADNWGISLNVKNFTNQRYYVEANAAGAVLGEPLSAFVRIYFKQ
jgi:iron complex outermembrane recepter protein